MRPNKHVVERKSTMVSTEKTKFTFDEGSLPYTMNLLTRLYPDPIMACIREVATNALDSHRASNTTRPIEVSTPNSFNSNFIVRDFGLGMSKDSLFNIYTRYGASTKRESDDQAGMMGLGCKAPLAHTDQFTLTSIHDGVKYEALISRADDGGVELEIMIEEETDEANGVTVTIPAHGQQNAFISKSRALFAFWDQEDVLIDGEKPVNLEGEYLSEGVLAFKISESSINQTTLNLPGMNKDDRLGYRYHNAPKLIVVMGSVPYVVNPNDFNISLRQILPDYGKFSQCSIVLNVPIGTVDPAPSREALEQTNRTKETLQKQAERISGLIRDYVKEEIKSAKTPYQALRRWNLYMGHGTSAMQGANTIWEDYKGREFDLQEPYMGSYRNKFFITWVDNTRRRLQDGGLYNELTIRCTYDHNREITAYVPFTPGNKVHYIIVGFPAGKLAGTNRKIMESYVRERYGGEKDPFYGKCILVLRKDTEHLLKWFGGEVPILRWDDISAKHREAVLNPNTKPKTKSAPAPVPVAQGYVDGLKREPITTAKTVVYWTTTDRRNQGQYNVPNEHQSIRRCMNDFFHFLDRKEICHTYVTKGSQQKFFREYGESCNLIHIYDWLENTSASSFISPRLDPLLVITLESFSKLIPLLLKASYRIKDPDFRRILPRKDTESKYQEAQRIMSRYGTVESIFKGHQRGDRTPINISKFQAWYPDIAERSLIANRYPMLVQSIIAKYDRKLYNEEERQEYVDTVVDYVNTTYQALEKDNQGE